MGSDSDTQVQRQLLLTPEAQHLLEGEYSSEVKELAEYISHALDGSEAKDGFIRLTGTRCLLHIIDATQGGGPERVVVWEGRTDGIIYKEEILNKTFSLGTGFV